jgi:hypothetical protein
VGGRLGYGTVPKMPPPPVDALDLQILSDQEGSVALGWLEEGVLYARFAGALSAPLGQRFAAQLRVLVGEASSVAYFSDGSLLTHYDLLARSAVTRVLLENRRKFSKIVLLVWVGGITASTRAFVSAIGEPVTLARDDAEFLTELRRVAPMAPARLASRTGARGVTGSAER